MEYDLYVVAVPIGNLKDITIRAIEVLKEVDYILTEDTRESFKLLKEYGIDSKLISYEKFSEEKKKEDIRELIDKGFKIALITDRGSPVISDPGYILINYLLENSYKVTSIPGPSALVNAVILSGLKSDRFEFLGFLPRENGKRESLIKKTINYDGLSIIYESPKRLVNTLEEIKKICPGRNLAVVREMTKMYEEIFRGQVEEAIEKFKNFSKGEIVIVLDSYFLEKKVDVEKELRELIELGISKKDAVKKVSEDFNLNKNDVYKISLSL